MQIAVLQYPNAVMSSVVGPYDMFSQVNDLVQSFRPDIELPKVEVSIVQLSEIDDHTNYDLVVLPAMQFTHIDNVIRNSQQLTPWLKKQYKNGAEIASICLGAFLLAESGLLDNLSATTHWLGAGLFKARYPKVKLVDDKFITDFRRIYTSGGAFSFTTLVIYLIDKYFGNEVAILLSKVFLIHLHNSQQTSYKILAFQKQHNNEAIETVQNFIEHNIEKTITVEALAEKAGMSVRTFMRNFKKATGDTPNAYIQKVRVEMAKKMLESSEERIEQISLLVGYNDFASFRKTFKKTVGLNPSEYKRLYNRPFTQVNVSC